MTRFVGILARPQYHARTAGRSATVIPRVPPAWGMSKDANRSRKTFDAQIETLIENHRTKKATGAPLYADALRELEKRKGKELDFDKSLSIIWQAAKEGQYLSYKELADASGAGWTQVHYEIGRHLWRLVEYAHQKELPMLSAIVVNKANVDSGRMEPDTLKGFVGAARLLGYAVTDEEAFLKEQQARVFVSAKKNPAMLRPAGVR